MQRSTTAINVNKTVLISGNWQLHVNTVVMLFTNTIRKNKVLVQYYYCHLASSINWTVQGVKS